jgi:hypothetical protein
MDCGRSFMNFKSGKMWKKVDREYFESFCKDIIWGFHSFLVISYSVAGLLSLTAEVN